MEKIVVNGEEFTVTRATADDVETLALLLADDILGSSREPEGMSGYREAFRVIDEDPKQFLAVVRKSDGEVCGTFQLSLLTYLSRGGTTRLQVEAVRLSPATRGRGLGTALFGWVHAWGRQHGATLAQLSTDKQRKDAHRFYDALGYTASHEGYKLPL